MSDEAKSAATVAHYGVWRFVDSDSERFTTDEVEVCAVCSPKHTPCDLWVTWPCPLADGGTPQ